ncbi:MAG: tRNA (pseudouridine(54)-N(1))-methyltransferase TrmY [Candidatus Aenigmarchaeota archaeon]|nr:tRNA (pseudouridine(54)-N(1))-methyltransferase TrmY [Candidatus Aenigmarchaeota archaeon]
MIREFIVRARKARTDPFFNLNDLPGSGGRMDLVARCISSALFVSENLRKDTIVHVVLEGPSRPPRIVTFYGETLRKVAPDERNIASHIKIALEKGLNLKTGEEIDVSPGIKISKKSWESLIKEKQNECKLFYLHSKGERIGNIDLEKYDHVCFILGDHKGMPKKSEQLLKKLNVERISLGRVTYFASHSITIAHYELDKRIF